MRSLDVFQSSLGLLNDVLKKAYLGLTRYAPGVWSGIYSMLDNSTRLESNLLAFGNLKSALAANPRPIPARLRPLHLPGLCPRHPRDLPRPFRAAVPLHHRRDGFHFRQLLLVPRAQRLVLRAQRGHRRGACAKTACRRKASGPSAFPSTRFLPRNTTTPPRRPSPGAPVKILYIINTGKKKSGKAIDRLLEMPRVHLTITVGRDAELKEKLARAHGKIRRPRRAFSAGPIKCRA